jgi:RNA polymerase-binding transcription factor DksA
MQSLEPLERLSLRDQLQELWRAKVEQITTLAVRFHSIEPDFDPDEEPALVAEHLARLRLELNEVEAAMRRMDVGRFGECERCESAIDYDELTARPHRRRCSTCDANGASTRHRDADR